MNENNKNLGNTPSFKFQVGNSVTIRRGECCGCNSFIYQLGEINGNIFYYVLTPFMTTSYINQVLEDNLELNSNSIKTKEEILGYAKTIRQRHELGAPALTFGITATERGERPYSWGHIEREPIRYKPVVDYMDLTEPPAEKKKFKKGDAVSFNYEGSLIYGFFKKYLLGSNLCTVDTIKGEKIIDHRNIIDDSIPKEEPKPKVKFFTSEEILEILNQEKSSDEIIFDLKDHVTN